MVAWLKKNRSCRILLEGKTDCLYRNLRDAVALEDLDIEIHLVKEGRVISKDSSRRQSLCTASPSSSLATTPIT